MKSGLYPFFSGWIEKGVGTEKKRRVRIETPAPAPAPAPELSVEDKRIKSREREYVLP